MWWDQSWSDLILSRDAASRNKESQQRWNQNNRWCQGCRKQNNCTTGRIHICHNIPRCWRVRHDLVIIVDSTEENVCEVNFQKRERESSATEWCGHVVMWSSWFQLLWLIIFFTNCSGRSALMRRKKQQKGNSSKWNDSVRKTVVPVCLFMTWVFFLSADLQCMPAMVNCPSCPGCLSCVDWKEISGNLHI